MLSYKETLGYRRDLVEQVDSLSFFGIPFLSCYHHDLADSLDKQKTIDVDEAATAQNSPPTHISVICS